MKRSLIIAALATFALASAANAQLTREQAERIQAQMDVPIGCTITRTFEDYTALAVCAGGYVVVLNAQGEGDKAADILYAIGSYTIHDAAGRAYTYPVYD